MLQRHRALGAQLLHHQLDAGDGLGHQALETGGAPLTTSAVGGHQLKTRWCRGSSGECRG
jgi:hypothetical protein